MNDEMIKIIVASIIVDTYYDKLRYLNGINMEDTDESKEIIDKIKHCVKVENKEYRLLNTDNLLNILVAIEKDEINNLSLPRIYSKLTYEARMRENSPAYNGILLSDAITTKLLIDILKTVEYKLIRFSNNGMEEDTLNMLKLYHNIHKYSYLTSNNYIESLALKQDFQVKKMPTLYFTDMEDNYSVNFIEQSKGIFLNQATNSIDDFLTLKMDDEHAYAYSILFGLAKIQTIFNYLGYQEMNRLQNYIDDNFKNSERKNTVKSLIKKRKEELN